jgi:hypothetical protein
VWPSGAQPQEEQLTFASQAAAHSAGIFIPCMFGGIVSVLTIGQTDGEPTEMNVSLITVSGAVAFLAQAVPLEIGSPCVG